jgi:hypothetical protein
MVSPMVLLIFLALIAQNHGAGWLTAADVTFLAILGGIFLTRWLEFRTGHALTATGDPATAGQLRHFAGATIALGLAAWVLANLFANHWVKR